MSHIVYTVSQRFASSALVLFRENCFIIDHFDDTYIMYMWVLQLKCQDKDFVL